MNLSRGSKDRIQSGKKCQFRIFSGSLSGIFRCRMFRMTTNTKMIPMGT